MKIKKTRIKQLLKLSLLKLRVYEQFTNKTKLNGFVDSNLNQIIVNIKKVLQIIFQYHKAEKRILFVGVPCELEQKINQLTKHIAVPKNFDIQGMVSNFDPKVFLKSENLDQAWSKNFLKSLLPKLSKKLDLIVLFNHEKSDSILTESKIAKIPVIFFGVNQDPLKSPLYSVEGDFKNLLTGPNQNILSIGLNFLFK
jgi:ribosomal protein S2|tara:strand:+ start:279 stop:869 length:591 start_codon:yes stop_codon:yes gene_type:complete